MRTFPLEKGLPPTRKEALLSCSFVVSGTSEVSISSSRIALMRSQSVRESFKVDFLLIFRCLSHRNDTDVISFFGMGDHNNYAFEKTKGDETFFSIVETAIFKGQCDALKDFLRIDKIEAMVEDVGLALLFIPCKFHASIICMIMQIWKENFRARHRQGE